MTEFSPEIDAYIGAPADVYVYKEQNRCYGAMKDRLDGANILEFGAHCGFFNLWARRNAKPKKIVSIEPDPATYAVLEKNCGATSVIRQAAVVGADYASREVTLYRSKTYSSKNTIEPVRGREQVDVPAVKFKSLLRGINVIKCDCEGGEYGLDWEDLPDSVHTIAIEFHFNKPDWTIERIQRPLFAQGFKPVRAPKYNSFSKVGIGIYKR